MSKFVLCDPRAFDMLYRRHRLGLYRYIWRLLGVRINAQVDEVFQDTWLRVITARNTWDPQKASFKTWLYALAHHRAIDLLRRQGHEVSLDDHDESDEPWEPTADSVAWSQWPQPSSAPSHTEELAFWRRAGERLLACLDQLPVQQRSAFLLRHDDDMSLEEVAKALEIGFETAKTRLRYAMSKLRTCMGAYLSPTPGGKVAP